MYYSHRSDFFSFSLNPTVQGLQNSRLFIAGANSSSFPWLLLRLYSFLYTPSYHAEWVGSWHPLGACPFLAALCPHCRAITKQRSGVVYTLIAQGVLAWGPVQSQPVKKPRICKGEGNPEICRSQDFTFSFSPGCLSTSKDIKCW